MSAELAVNEVSAPAEGATAPAASYGLLELMRSDYRKYCERRGDGRRAGLLKAPHRLVTNASLRALVLVRLTCAAPRWLHWFFRSLLVTLHSSEVVYGARIGPELWLPHPYGIGIGGLVRIGRGAVICQNVTLASSMASDGQPQLGDNVIVLSGAMVAGTIRVGNDAVVGANCVLEEDLADGGVCAPARTRVVNRRINWPNYRVGSRDELQE